ncbi:MAG: hypothetical protein A3D39_01000 [Candidatus Buchananbacteria bacterium RIFCSPHIGHO2_02_FULL_39_17]|nr:MAG: hypothetical protein A3D39_01000 [Candidatus Buchananbacteria bacterium RIFCSPHIGHO2_02_FULL_39_17]
MQRAGYAEHQDFNTRQTSYTKRLAGDFYPRFHVYSEKDHDQRQFLNLHLDQKKPSYAGAHAHNAEYEGDLVEEEANRLQGLIKNQMDNQGQGSEIRNQQSDQKGFWEKLFGQ